MEIGLNQGINKRYPYFFALRCKKTSRIGHLSCRSVLVLLAFVGVSLLWLPVEAYWDASLRQTSRSEQNIRIEQVRQEQILVRNISHIIQQHETGLTPAVERQLAAFIVDAGRRYELDPLFILAVIRTESFFNSRAVSFADAHGLMQILPEVGEELSHFLNISYQGDLTLFNPILNVELGTFFLAKLIRQFDGNVEQALLAYNRGPNGVRTALANGTEIPRHYAQRVFYHYEILQKWYEGAHSSAEV